MKQSNEDNQVRNAGLLLGAALSASFDGIVFHQILGWHHMGSNVVPPTTPEAFARNLLWDGFFNASAVLLGVIGLVLLWRAARRPPPLPSSAYFGGLLLIGFGLFNLIEGVIDHHLLQIHHVREVANPLPWDLGFLLLLGLLPLLVGWLLTRRERVAA